MLKTSWFSKGGRRDRQAISLPKGRLQPTKWLDPLPFRAWRRTPRCNWKVETLLRKGLVGEFEMPPFPRIGLEAEAPHKVPEQSSIGRCCRGNMGARRAGKRIKAIVTRAKIDRPVLKTLAFEGGTRFSRCRRIECGKRTEKGGY